MNKNAKAFSTIKTESSNNFKPVNLKTILKLEGKRDHCNNIKNNIFSKNYFNKKLTKLTTKN